MARTESPLRYPGGKSQLAKFVSYTIKLNEIEEGIYCEPFAGGFGVGLELLYSNTVESLIINDFDIGIYSIWNAILNEAENFIKLIHNTPITIDEWYNQKNIYAELVEQGEYTLELGFATFFLNRTNISGIINAGPIGGRSQKSKYKIDCRFNKKTSINKVKKINSYREDIVLYNMEANDLIEKVLLEQPKEKLFTFFDPPYYEQGKNLYTNFFIHDDHENLKEKIKKMNNFYWIITYDVNEEISNIYSEYRELKYNLRYSANRVRKESELMFHSPITLVESYDKVNFEDDLI